MTFTICRGHILSRHGVPGLTHRGKQELEKQRLEAQFRAETGGIRDGLGTRHFKTSRPKLLSFDEKTDGMDAYGCIS